MLTEKRQEEIVRLVYERESITVAELKEILHSSESTIRRDIIALDQEGRLTKVFGGAIALRTAQIVNKELSMVQKKDLQTAEKQAIARYAASLIERDDCVYLDAGTSTGWMIEYIRETQATYVTNALSHAKRLADKGFHVILIGGEPKSSTDAIVGAEAVVNLQKYHFNKGFFTAVCLTIASLASGVVKPPFCSTPFVPKNPLLKWYSVQRGLKRRLFRSAVSRSRIACSAMSVERPENVCLRMTV